MYQQQQQEQQAQEQDAENPFLDPPFSRIKSFCLECGLCNTLKVQIQRQHNGACI
jgi:hypothetical protein